MLVPDGQLSIVVNDGFSGERHVKVVSPNTTVQSVLDDIGTPGDLSKITLRLRNGTDSRTVTDTTLVFQDGDVLTISPSKQGAGA